MKCRRCGKELKSGEPDVYCKPCKRKVKEQIEKITPEEFEAYIMTNWRRLFK